MKYFLFTAIAMCSLISSNAQLKYPAAPKDGTVDEYFGIKVADPYRPLENDTAVVTLDWVKAENAVTDAYINAIPFRDKVRDRLTQLNNYRKTGMSSLANDGMFYFYDNDGLQNQSVLYRIPRDPKAADALPDNSATPEVFLDPNKLSADGTVALTGISMSPDGKYTAYTISRNGSDWTEIYVMETASKQPLADHVEWAKFTSAVWHGDGFYYSAYDRPAAGKEVSNINENHRIYYHKLGTPQSEDILIFEDPANPLHFHRPYVPRTQDYIAVIGEGEGLGSSIMIKKLASKEGPTAADAAAEWVVVEPTQDNSHAIMAIRDGKLYVQTTWGAPRGRVMVADLDAPQIENWREFVPEDKGVLSSARFNKDYLILEYEKDAASRIYIHDKATGERIQEVKLPTYGTAYTVTHPDYSGIRYGFSSFTHPSEHYTYDVATGLSRLDAATEIPGVNLDDYVTEQVFYPSADGTMIPMFLTYRKDVVRDGSNPVYLYGYGGFNISLPPSFSANRMVWLENGGILAIANLRGGSEYGDEWHIAGTKQQKLNVFNDFISAAEYLVREGWTTPEHIAIEGASNGGLLVGAVTNMRPDLFKVAIPRVGVMDMMRYHLFTIGWNWASDYGTSADSPEMAEYLLGYSPIHNIKSDGTPYPAILVTTADHDDRVVPAHSFKYAATLQAADTGNAPKLIRIDSNAGHGAGKPIAKVIDEYADLFSFIFFNLGVEPK